MRYAFWNNKGGTGKTSLAFQAITEYAIKNPAKKILVLDLCPQANLSELFMGGLLGNGGANLEVLYKQEPFSRSIGGYFQTRLSSPYKKPSIDVTEFIVTPYEYNANIPDNIELVAGDKAIELQSNAISTLSINQIPGFDSYIQVINWLNNFVEEWLSLNPEGDVFIDTNPSFSMYTQIALATTERLIIPVMADDSSRRALRNVFALVYGIDLDGNSATDYLPVFSTKITEAGMHLPQIHLILKNRITQYMGPASAYSSVLRTIDNEITSILSSNPTYFTFSDMKRGVVEIKDFQTAGVVAFAEATPFSRLKSGTHTIQGKDTQVNIDKKKECEEAIERIVDNL